MCNMSEAFHWQKVLYVTSYDTVWWKGLCVLVCGKALLGRSVWRDTLDCTLHTETFPLSLWWEFRSETWSEKTYWRSAWSKIVICGIHVFCEVTCWHISVYQHTWILTSATLPTQVVQIAWNYFSSFISYIFCINVFLAVQQCPTAVVLPQGGRWTANCVLGIVYISINYTLKFTLLNLKYLLFISILGA